MKIGTWAIESREVGKKRWYRHIPPIPPGFMESAEVRANRKCLEWAQENPGREYRCVPVGPSPARDGVRG